MPLPLSFIQLHPAALQRMPTPPQLTLAARWIAASQAEASHDQAVVAIIERSLKGESVNEAALLKALLSHADALAAAGGSSFASEAGE